MENKKRESIIKHLTLLGFKDVVLDWNMEDIMQGDMRRISISLTANRDIATKEVQPVHLRFSLETAFMDCDEKRHAQVVMKELGITYQHAVPQSMGDQWWFWNCENVPKKLPEYITILDIIPQDAIGYGLSEEDVVKIVNYKK